MIKFSKFNLFSMALLAGAAAFTGCSSDEVIVEEQAPVTGPLTFNGESVKTQFSINIPAAGSHKRLTESVTQGQATPVFRGMKNIFMVPFAQDGDVTGTSTLSPKGVIGLTAFNTFQISKPNANYYSDVDIPVNTNHMLFYAEGGAESETTKNQYGSLKPVYDTNTWTVTTPLQNAISFELGQIAAGGDNSTETVITNNLNAIARTTGWSSITLDQSSELYNAYVGFTSLKAGSAKKILYTVNSLYQIVKDKAEQGNTYEAIKNNITKEGSIFTANTDGNIEYNSTLQNQTYPENLGIPSGVAQLTFNTETKSFTYRHSSTTPIIGGMSAADFDDYVYPTSLYYCINSDIKASSLSSDQIASDNNWTSYVNNTSQFDQSKVEPNSQLVVLESPVQYAVARFVVIPRFSESTILDKNEQTIINLANGMFPVKGLLVGGQKNVNWAFHQQAEAKEVTIYDASLDVVSNGVTSTSTDKYQTLVLETPERVTNEEAVVNFALEMVNNTGAPFYGADGIVPEGGTFYLVGKLSTTSTDTDNTRVFAQDKVTTANVKINSLANAYNVVPDLRATKLSFGLSVDLTWQNGLTNEVVIE